MIHQINEAVDFLKGRGFGTPEVGIILGTGLGKILDSVEVEAEMSYNHIPYFPTATVEFHTGKLIYGSLGGKKVVLMQGRFHVYEGYSLQDVTFPVRVMHKMGVKRLLVSNASGALNLNFPCIYVALYLRTNPKNIHRFIFPRCCRIDFCSNIQMMSVIMIR